MNLDEFILGFGEKAQKLIEEYETFKTLKGDKKKERVVDLLSQWINNTLKDVKMNKVLKFIIKMALPQVLSPIVQVAFNLIEARIEGITK